MRCLLAALFLAACADDASTSRDYTVTECPGRFSPAATMLGPEVCDRGVGASPRFATVEACVAELGLSIPAGSWGLTSTHPARERCVNAGAAALDTIEDVRVGVTRAQ